MRRRPLGRISACAECRDLPDIRPRILDRRPSVAVRHVRRSLDRFSARAQSPLGADMISFLNLFFNTPAIVMCVGPSDALVFDHQKSMVAFPFRETD